jgi:pyrroline-5-carboxylate reductase-like protein
MTSAGCTIEGLLELEEGKLRFTLIKAVVKATFRAGELFFEKINRLEAEPHHPCDLTSFPQRSNAE